MKHDEKELVNDMKYAGFWIRCAAALIDALLLMIITLPLTLILYGDSYWISEEIILGPADFLINYIFPFFAVILFWYYKSATPGKIVLNIKIVNASDGNKLTGGQILGRYFAYIPATLVLLIGIFWIGIDKKKQGWHDKLAKTVVIYDRKK